MIDIDELRRLTQAATPGPWRVYEVGVGFEIAAGDNVIAQAQSIPRDSVQHVARRANAAFIAAANPAAISELLDCLEAAESDGLEQARLNGMGSEREAALLSKLEAAEKAINEAYQRGYATGREEIEKERDQFKFDWLECLKLAEEAKPIIDRQRSEIDALRAKIAQMEKQEPVKHEFQGRDGAWHSFIDQRHYENTVADGTWPIRSLYTLPGAKGEDK